MYIINKSDISSGLMNFLSAHEVSTWYVYDVPRMLTPKVYLGDNDDTLKYNHYLLEVVNLIASRYNVKYSGIFEYCAAEYFSKSPSGENEVGRRFQEGCVLYNKEIDLKSPKRRSKGLLSTKCDRMVGIKILLPWPLYVEKGLREKTTIEDAMELSYIIERDGASKKIWLEISSIFFSLFIKDNSSEIIKILFSNGVKPRHVNSHTNASMTSIVQDNNDLSDINAKAIRDVFEMHAYVGELYELYQN